MMIIDVDDQIKMTRKILKMLFCLSKKQKQNKKTAKMTTEISVLGFCAAASVRIEKIFGAVGLNFFCCRIS